jgi:hypothetical protein
MAEKTYSLYNDAEILDQRLAVEIGDSYIVLVTGTGGKISGLEYFTTDENTLEEILNEIGDHSSLIKKNYSETRVYYNLKETVLVPVGQFNTSVASEFVDLAFGNTSASRVNVENINIAPGIVNVYRSNENWQEIISKYFRAVTKRHLYSKLVEQAVTNNEQLRVIFYKDSFTIVAVKNKQLKIVRSFDYKNDADALYHILNVCKQVDIDAADTSLFVSGFIEKDSSLFQLLKKYIGTAKLDNASYDALPADQQSQYPHHYFTSFINLLS